MIKQLTQITSTLDSIVAKLPQLKNFSNRSSIISKCDNNSAQLDLQKIDSIISQMSGNHTNQFSVQCCCVQEQLNNLHGKLVADIKRLNKQLNKLNKLCDQVHIIQRNLNALQINNTTILKRIRKGLNGSNL
ncbi:Hypothetical_protein [Hexamita inflata]|uniref:Hypothetical_protein n=1 Tax=Hexamita inflata TaxID=28002 RepID=A0AA86PYI4_9EUKA|nr:Hypothetical protein HINF_LOCUS36350 [Hexamita inflata]